MKDAAPAFSSYIREMELGLGAMIFIPLWLYTCYSITLDIWLESMKPGRLLGRPKGCSNGGIKGKG